MRFLILIALFFSSTFQVYAAPFTVKTVDIHGYQFPIVESGRENVDRRINDWLKLDFFGTPFPEKQFKEVEWQAFKNRKPHLHKFGVNENNERVFSIHMQSEICVNSCGSYFTYYNFDASTGRYISYADVFTKKGETFLAKHLAKSRIAKVETTQLDADTKDTYLLCIKLHSNPAVLGLHNEGIQISGSNIIFINSICVNRAVKKLDTIGEFNNKLSSSELSSHLSSYGKYLLLGEKETNGLLLTPFNQTLRGKIAGKLIVIHLDIEEGGTSVRGNYFYDKYGKPIEVTGELTGNSLRLNEFSEDSKTLAVKKSAVMNLTIKGETLTGQWVQGEKSLPVEIGP